MDTFNEYMVKRKKGGKEAGLICGMILLALVLLFLATFVFFFSIISFYPIIVAAIIYFLYMGITSLNVEYEYSVTNGELDVDKIVSKRRRVNVANVCAKDFEFFAPVSEKYKDAYYDNTITRKIDATSNSNSGKEYFAVYYGTNNSKVMLIFEPTERMIEDFEKYASRRVFHKI